MLVHKFGLLLVRCRSCSVHNVHCKPDNDHLDHEVDACDAGGDHDEDDHDAGEDRDDDHNTMAMFTMTTMAMFTSPDTLLTESPAPFQSQDLCQ